MRPLLLTILALLAAPAAASAEKLKGSTSQGRKASLTTDADGVAKKAEVGWKADCSGDATLTDTTGITFGDDGDLIVVDDYTINDDNGIKIDVSFSYKAKRKGAGSYKGDFRATGVVRRNGKKIDTCKTPKITFSVTGAVG